jgi:NDP-sugar pyrophosphorylase family protein
MSNYRNLTSDEIIRLEQNHCVCDDWSKVSVGINFDAKYVRRVQFSGTVRLGVYEESFAQKNGLTKHSGIYDVCLHDTEVGDNTLIENIQNYISNYRIGNNCFIQNVNSIIAFKNASFGNNVKVSSIDESGGRPVMLFDKLSSHLAYFQAAYRYNSKLIEQLEKIIQEYRQQQIPEKGIIEDHVKICNAGKIKDVIIRHYTYIDGSAKLVNGTIVSEKDAPTYLGRSVIAEDFIAAAGASIEDSVFLNNCFIGQAACLKRGFSATESLFFSNCHLEHGEACAAFAGPYTVSHHKPTLLIAAMFSFVNAGSGTNQSNHLYKLGPIHQGITERGLKTSSNCYLMWPAHIGAFTFVNGKHYLHPDTSLFPFSYLLEENESSTLVPGLGLKNVSLLRDEKKWKSRDKRKVSKVLDYIHPNVFSPYTMEKVFSSINILKSLKQNPYSEKYNYNGCYIKHISIDKGVHLYKLAITKYLGDVLLNYLGKKQIDSWKEIPQALCIDTQKGSGAWVDLAGLLMPKSRSDLLLSAIVSGSIKSVEEIDLVLDDMFKDYSEFEFMWAVDKLKTHFGLDDSISPEKFIQFVEKWENASNSIYSMMQEDLKKEFSNYMTVGFGLDNPDEKEQDIIAVRGKWEENPIAETILGLIAHTHNTASRWRSII